MKAHILYSGAIVVVSLLVLDFFANYLETADRHGWDVTSGLALGIYGCVWVGALIASAIDG